MQRLFRYSFLVASLLIPSAGRADRLTDDVIEAFRTLAPDIRVTARTDDELLIDRQERALTVQLVNLRAACAASQDECAGKVASFVQGIASVAKSSEAAFDQAKLYAVLKSAGYGRRSSDSFREADKELVVLPFAGDLEVLFAIDGDKAFRFVNRGDLKTAGLGEQALLELASSNASRLPPPTPGPIKGVPGLYFAPTGDGLATARAFDAALWDKFEDMAGGPVAMAVPTRDWLLFTLATRPDQVASLRTIAGRIVKGEPYPVSDVVMVRDGKRWKVLVTP